jgi:isopenicillin-N N-acyltransferase like protein
MAMLALPPTAFRRHPRPSLILLLVAALLAHVSATEEASTTWEKGRIATRTGISLAELQGSPADLGNQAGQLMKERIKGMIALVHLYPGAGHFAQPPAIPDAYRQELAALAKTAGVDEQELIAANLLVGTMCTAVVRLPTDQQPLLVARNMDFSPAQTLGPKTVVTVVRPTGKHAFANIGWPGFTAVVSGMNDAGVSVCVLLRHGGRGQPGGTPLLYRLRSLLEDAANLDQAIATFRASPVAGGDFVLIADPAGAVVVWCDGQEFHRADPAAGWLFCTNTPMTAAGVPDDQRGRQVRDLAAGATAVDAAWMRRVLSSAYLTGINAQAMVFVPKERHLFLALGSSFKPAALSAWSDLDLAPVLAGKGVDTTVVQNLGPTADPLPHFDRTK